MRFLVVFFLALTAFSALVRFAPDNGKAHSGSVAVQIEQR